MWLKYRKIIIERTALEEEYEKKEQEKTAKMEEDKKK